jgi:heterodisulfide reductase subunit C
MAVAELPRTIVPKPSFRRQVEEMGGDKVSACYQCEKCTNGCPVAYAMDIVPHKLIRSVHLGLKDEVLDSDTIWICASCETCTTRCPNGIDIAHVMDTLRQISQREGRKASQKDVPIFHSAFLSSVKRHGRVHEGEMAVTYALRSGGLRGLLGYSSLGLAMFKRGKVKLLPSSFLGNRQVREFFSTAERKGQ